MDARSRDVALYSPLSIVGLAARFRFVIPDIMILALGLRFRAT